MITLTTWVNKQNIATHWTARPSSTRTDWTGLTKSRKASLKIYIPSNTSLQEFTTVLTFFQSGSYLVTDYIWRCLHLLWPLARTDWSRPQESAGELLLVFKTHCSRELNEKTPPTSGIPLPVGQVWVFSLLLHRLPLHCRALSYNCEVVVS